MTARSHSRSRRRETLRARKLRFKTDQKAFRSEKRRGIARIEAPVAPPKIDQPDQYQGRDLQPRERAWGQAKGSGRF